MDTDKKGFFVWFWGSVLPRILEVFLQRGARVSIPRKVPDRLNSFLMQIWLDLFFAMTGVCLFGNAFVGATQN